MSNSNVYLQDVVTRHQIFVQRFAGGKVKNVEKYLDEIQKALFSVVNQYDVVNLSRSDELKLIKALTDLYDVKMSVMANEFLNDLKEFSAYEATFISNALTVGLATTTVMKLPSEALIDTILNGKHLFTKPGKRGLTIEKALAQFKKNKKKDIKNIVNQAVINGTPNAEVLRGLDLQTKKAKQQTNTLIRTSVNAISNETRKATYGTNKKYFKGFRYIATLDSRTTILCGSRDGIVYDYDEVPTLPAHWGCRSTISPSVKDKYRLENIKGVRKYRPSTEGAVDAQLTYPGWLKSQPFDVQANVLGPQRAELFAKGKLDLDQFIDNDGVVLTLDELKLKEKVSLS
jgi:SPP1 gp7 family putative phage head morphogenesis protein